MEIRLPEVNAHAEFYEIASDFGEPLEIVREAISNAFDCQATYIAIEASIDQSSGFDQLVLEFTDNGTGMSYEVLRDNFWDLGNSTSRNSRDKIGEKGHGTKIYLRSERIQVETTDGKSVSTANCDHPFKDLNAGHLHTVTLEEGGKLEHLGEEQGTYIRIEGYNNNQMEVFTQGRMRDYIYWFTKLGSFEGEIKGNLIPNFEVRLKALDKTDFETLPFGHPFPKEKSNVNKLYDRYKDEASSHFVKKYEYSNEVLPERPYIKFDMVVYVEGDAAKREYNPMLGERKSKKGLYKVGDRYGLWLCKDFIPVQRVNDWITGFGTGSNSVTLLHGFINCQNLKLTANRGTVANTDPVITAAIKKRVNEILDEIDIDLYKKQNFDILKQLNESEKTDLREKAEYEKRTKEIQSRTYYPEIKGIHFYQPSNESELFGLFISFYTLFQDDFMFEPLDYNTTVGVDVLARNKSGASPADCEYWYVELKKTLTNKAIFNHSFGNIRYILCWNLDKDVKIGSIFESVHEEKRELKQFPSKDGIRKYQLVDPSGKQAIAIKVILLKDLIEAKCKELAHEVGFLSTVYQE